MKESRELREREENELREGGGDKRGGGGGGGGGGGLGQDSYTNDHCFRLSMYKEKRGEGGGGGVKRRREEEGGGGGGCKRV